MNRILAHSWSELSWLWSWFHRKWLGHFKPLHLHTPPFSKALVGREKCPYSFCLCFKWCPFLVPDVLPQDSQKWLPVSLIYISRSSSEFIIYVIRAGVTQRRGNFCTLFIYFTFRNEMAHDAEPSFQRRHAEFSSLQSKNHVTIKLYNKQYTPWRVGWYTSQSLSSFIESNGSVQVCKSDKFHCIQAYQPIYYRRCPFSI